MCNRVLLRRTINCTSGKVLYFNSHTSNICSQTINTDDLIDDNLYHKKVLLAFSRMQSGFLHTGTEILQLCCNCVVCLIHHHIASQEAPPW